MKLEIKKFSKGYAIYAGVSRLSKFFKSADEAQVELDKNDSYYRYYMGSASVSVDNSDKTIIDAQTGKSKRVSPYLDKHGRIMHENMKLAEKLLNLFEKLTDSQVKILLKDIKEIRVRGAEGPIKDSQSIEKLKFKSVSDFEKHLKKYPKPDLGYNKMDMVIEFKDGSKIEKFRYDHGHKDDSFVEQLTWYLKNNVSVDEKVLSILEKEYDVKYVFKNPPAYAKAYPDIWKESFTEYLKRQGHDASKITKVDNIEWNEVVRIFNTLLGVKNRKRPDDYKKGKNKDLKVESDKNLFENKKFKNKQELVDFIKHQVNVELKNDDKERFNDKRNILYTKVGKDQNEVRRVLSLLDQHKIRRNQHMDDYYWIWIK